MSGWSGNAVVAIASAMGELRAIVVMVRVTRSEWATRSLVATAFASRHRLARGSGVSRRRCPVRGAVPALGPQRDVGETDQHRDFGEWADGAGEGLAAGDAEHGDGNGDGELEVVARCDERHRAMRSQGRPRR